MPPPTIPSNLPTILSSLRSSIFGSFSNPTGSRTGAKYLRRRLVGPSLLRYYPKSLNLSALNAATPYNRYANWEGFNPATFQQISTARAGSQGQVEKWGEMTWRSSGMQKIGAVTEEGWKEVERVKGAGWVDDARERVRAEEVMMRKRAGKGPPKKGEWVRAGLRVSLTRVGQGKRSQMKKR
jgi:hypothetical protein